MMGGTYGRPGAALGLALLLSGCSEGASGHAISSSASGSAAEVRSGIWIEGSAIVLDGERVGDAADPAAPIPALHDALRARREAWKKAKPTLPFPGKIDVALPDAVSCKAALGILETCAEAGFPNLSLKLGGVQRPLGLSASAFNEPWTRAAHLWFRADGSVEIRRHRCQPAYDVVAVKDIVSPLQKLLPASKLGGARIGCDETVAFSTIAGVFDDYGERPAGLTRPMTIAFYQPCVRTSELAPLAASELGNLGLTIEVREDESGVGAAAIKTALDGVRERLLGCYAAARKEKPEIVDAVLLELEIGDKGRPVHTGAFAFDTSRRLEECIEVEAQALVVEPPPSSFAKLSLRVTFGPKPR